jgi:hypothetical protein
MKCIVIMDRSLYTYVEPTGFTSVCCIRLKTAHRTAPIKRTHTHAHARTRTHTHANTHTKSVCMKRRTKRSHARTLHRSCPHTTASAAGRTAGMLGSRTADARHRREHTLTRANDTTQGATAAVTRLWVVVAGHGVRRVPGVVQQQVARRDRRLAVGSVRRAKQIRVRNGHVKVQLAALIEQRRRARCRGHLGQAGPRTRVHPSTCATATPRTRCGQPTAIHTQHTLPSRRWCPPWSADWCRTRDRQRRTCDSDDGHAHTPRLRGTLARMIYTYVKLPNAFMYTTPCAVDTARHRRR